VREARCFAPLAVTTAFILAAVPAIGSGDAVTANAYFVVTSGSSIYPWVTVIDNQSGDFVWVTPFEDQ